MPQKNILLTGASGLLGQVLSRRLKDDYTVTGLSKTGRAGLPAMDLAVEGAAQSLFNKIQPDLVIHSAAYSDVDGCEKDPERAHQTNALTTKYLAEICQRRKIPMIYISTDYVFNGKKGSFYLETDEVFPINIYGMTKLLGEMHVRRSGIDAVIVRTSWLFGGVSSSNFVNLIRDKMLNSQEPLSILADQENAPTYTGDLSKALAVVAKDLLMRKSNGVSNGMRTYHVCNRGSTTRYAMTLEMKRILACSLAVSEADASTITGRPAVRPKYSAMSPAAFEVDFGMKMRPWQETLEDYLKRGVA